MHLKKSFAKKIITNNFKIIFFGVLFGLSLGYLNATYIAPSGPPSMSTNLLPPINEGIDPQIKLGDLDIKDDIMATQTSQASNSLEVTGDALFKTNVDISGLLGIGSLKVKGNMQMNDFLNGTYLRDVEVNGIARFGMPFNLGRLRFPPGGTIVPYHTVGNYDYQLACTQPSGLLFPCNYVSDGTHVYIDDSKTSTDKVSDPTKTETGLSKKLITIPTFPRNKSNKATVYMWGAGGAGGGGGCKTYGYGPYGSLTYFDSTSAGGAGGAGGFSKFDIDLKNNGPVSIRYEVGSAGVPTPGSDGGDGGDTRITSIIRELDGQPIPSSNFYALGGKGGEECENGFSSGPNSEDFENITAAKTFILDAYGGSFSSANNDQQQVSVSIGTGNECKINYFKANPIKFNNNSDITLSWSTSNCNNISISGVTGATNLSAVGTIKDPWNKVYDKKTYSIVATGTGGSFTASIKVVKDQLFTTQEICTINYLHATPQKVVSGGKTTISWEATYCQGITLNKMQGPIAKGGAGGLSGISGFIGGNGGNGGRYDRLGSNYTSIPCVPGVKGGGASGGAGGSCGGNAGGGGGGSPSDSISLLGTSYKGGAGGITYNSAYNPTAIVGGFPGAGGGGGGLWGLPTGGGSGADGRIIITWDE